MYISLSAYKVIVVMAFELECLHPNQVLNRWTFALENSSTR